MHEYTLGIYFFGSTYSRYNRCDISGVDHIKVSRDKKAHKGQKDTGITVVFGHFWRRFRSA